MTDIAASFDDTPSKDGGAMPELFFHDLVSAQQPPPSFFEMMWRQAQESVASGRWNLDGTSPAMTDTEIPARPEPQPDGDASDPQQHGQSSPERDADASEPGETTNEPSGAPQCPEGTGEAPIRGAEPSNEAAARPVPDIPDTNPVGESSAQLPSPVEQNFDDLIPKKSGTSAWPFLHPAWQPDRNGLLPWAFAAGHNAGPPFNGPPFGIGHNGGPPLEDTPAWRLFKARLLRGTALGALLEAVSPTVLNRGELEYLASIFAAPYGQLTGKLPQGFQAHHLNQNAAFGDVIPRDDGVSVGMRGDAISEPGTPHYVFHQSLEQFWDPYRPGGDSYRQQPTNAMYGEALQRALQASGRSPEEASYHASQAAADRAKYGLKEGIGSGSAHSKQTEPSSDCRVTLAVNQLSGP